MAGNLAQSGNEAPRTCSAKLGDARGKCRRESSSQGAFRVAPVLNLLVEDELGRSIAETAVAQLIADRDAGKDRRLFVRATSIKVAHC